MSMSPCYPITNDYLISSTSYYKRKKLNLSTQLMIRLNTFGKCRMQNKNQTRRKRFRGREKCQTNKTIMA